MAMAALFLASKVEESPVQLSKLVPLFAVLLRRIKQGPEFLTDIKSAPSDTYGQVSRD